MKRLTIFNMIIGSKIALMILLLVGLVQAQTIKIRDYYQLNAGNSWNYTAPPTWKGDYVSQMEKGDEVTLGGKKYPSVLHYDATRAAKILVFVKGKGIYYLGENFADKTRVVFDKPILWFPEKQKIGDKSEIEMGFTRTLVDRKITRGTYKLTQKIVAIEDQKVTAGEFMRTLRIESETFWDLGDGRKARSINAYNYAKNVGVIKASARFIILNAEGKETINRLVETDLKSYKVSN